MRGIAFALLAMLGAACAAPVSAVRVDPTVVHRELTGSVLSTGEPSRFSRNVLFLHGLHEAFEKDAEAALAAIDISSNREHFSDGTLSSGRLPTAVDNMSPAHPFVRTLVTLPLAPGVAGHSIVAVKGEGPVETGDDGVVKYESAHIDGVASEMVVRSEHSSQGRPETIEEIRRILVLHAGGQ